MASKNHYAELSALVGVMKAQGKPVKSYLEIGARHGVSLKYIGSHLVEPESNIVVVDLPGGPWGGGTDDRTPLQKTIDYLEEKFGHTITLFLGDSTDFKIVDAVLAFAPFDLVYIDGDHTFDGCRRDWVNYAPMAKAVALDDIVSDHTRKHNGEDIRTGVAEVWDIVKQQNPKSTAEFVANFGDKDKQGIGLVLL
jgi:predicted O-methyltransferase YrrM